MIYQFMVIYRVEDRRNRGSEHPRGSLGLGSLFAVEMTCMVSMSLAGSCYRVGLISDRREVLAKPEKVCFSCIAPTITHLQTYIFHLDIISHASDLNIEALEVNDRFFLDGFRKLSPESRLVASSNVLLNFLRVEIALRSAFRLANLDTWCGGPDIQGSSQ